MATRQPIQDRNAPTIKVNRGIKFFNAGDRISEPLSYSLPGSADIHAIAKHMIDAPENDFFYVPTELRLLAENLRVPVDFATTVIQRMGHRGVIMIDDEFEEDEEGQTASVAIASDDDSAKEKGARLWKEYTYKIVMDHIDSCHKAVAAGGYPRVAEGFTKRCLKLHNFADPAESALAKLKNTEATVSPDIAAVLESNRQLAAQVSEQSRQIAQLMHDRTHGATETALAKLGSKKTNTKK